MHVANKPRLDRFWKSTTEMYTIVRDFILSCFDTCVFFYLLFGLRFVRVFIHHHLLLLFLYVVVIFFLFILKMMCICTSSSIDDSVYQKYNKKKLSIHICIWEPHGYLCNCVFLLVGSFQSIIQRVYATFTCNSRKSLFFKINNLQRRLQ